MMSRADTALQVLFVDDEQRILDGLRRQFRSKRTVWTMRFANSGNQALHMLREQPADILVTDMRMPGMSGARLCEQVRQEWPHTVRYILSGQTDQFDLMADLGSIHQFLQKPCSPEMLMGSINRASMDCTSVLCTQARAAITGIPVLPARAQHLQQLCELLESPDPDPSRIAKVIEQDVGLASKVLQLMSSAFFGMPRHCMSIREAMEQLGIHNLRDLVMELRIFDHQHSGSRNQHLMDQSWRACNQISEGAYRLAIRSGLAQDRAEIVKQAGLMAGIGRAAIVYSMPDIDESVINRMSHHSSLIGAYLLGIWGLSEQIIEAVKYQCFPAESGVADRAHPLLWVHMARSLQTAPIDHEAVHFDINWASTLGLDPDDVEKLRSAA